MLEATGGGQKQLQSAHSAWGLPQREHGRAVSAEKMKDALRQKLLTLLPPLPYQAVCVPARCDKGGEGFVLSGHHCTQHAE